MIIWSSINYPTVIVFPAVCYFSREKPLVKPMAPRSLLIIFAFAIYFPLLLFSDLLNQKYLAAFLFYLAFNLSIYYNLSHVRLPTWGAVTRKGLTTPLTRWVSSSHYLCAGIVYVVLGGSPTGSITLVSSLREIPTVDMLHHLFLIGEIPT